MLRCERHPDHLFCECKQRAWIATPRAEREEIINSTNAFVGKKQKHMDWTDYQVYDQNLRSKFK